MLKLQNITYSINGADIFSEQSFSVGTQDHLLIIGRSGCGKTTLMTIMAGLTPPSRGDISLNAQAYAALSDRELDALRADNFGFVFQKLHLIGHLSVAQNIALAQTLKNTSDLERLINELGLAGKEHQRAQDLSLGEAQRVAIARAVANNPKVIFADEPTSALDDENTDKVMDLLLSQAEKTGASLIVSTHDARIKPRFKNVLEMTA